MASRSVSFGFLNRRRDQRAPAPPLEVTLNGERFRSINWSLGGVVIDGHVEGLVADDEVALDIALLGDDAAESFGVNARVVRNDHLKKRMAFNFTGLDEAAFATLQSMMVGPRHARVAGG